MSGPLIPRPIGHKKRPGVGPDGRLLYHRRPPAHARRSHTLQQHPLPGHALVTRRAVTELVEHAVVGSYGVIGFGSRNVAARLLGRLGWGTPGIRVQIVPRLDVELFLVVAFGVPIAEVAHNVESAVRYAVRHSLGRDLDSIAIHVHGLQTRDLRRDESGAPRG